MNGAVDNPLLKTLISQVKADVEIFHKCPYSGPFKITNFDMKEDKFFAIYPPGAYRTDVSFAREANGPPSVTVSLEALITPPPGRIG